ncbi:MAG: hypothetical protein K8R11_07620 [Methanococcoides sp.]|nr:hypothetical protein [Methanococcoides sp.]
MEKIKTYIPKAIIILLFIFSFYSLGRGSESILNNILDWEKARGLAGLYSFLAIFVLYAGYKSLKFSSYKYPQIILNMEYYLGVLDIIKQKKDNDDNDDELEKEIVEVEWLIEDIILFYSDKKRRRRNYHEHMLAKKLLHKVRRRNNTFKFINDDL